MMETASARKATRRLPTSVHFTDACSTGCARLIARSLWSMIMSGERLRIAQLVMAVTSLLNHAWGWAGPPTSHRACPSDPSRTRTRCAEFPARAGRYILHRGVAPLGTTQTKSAALGCPSAAHARLARLPRPSPTRSTLPGEESPLSGRSGQNHGPNTSPSDQHMVCSGSGQVNRNRPESWVAHDKRRSV